RRWKIRWTKGTLVRRRLLGTVGALAVLIIGVTACGDDRTDTQKDAGAPTSIVSPEDKGVPKDVALGERYVTPQGNSVTVHAFESPVAFAEAGFVLAGADVEGCAAATGTATTEALPKGVRPGTSPRLFRLQLSDGTLQSPEVPGVKEPALEEALLQPGECRRGWVTFRIPEQQKVVYVVLRSLSLVRWRVQ
ncbi:MAG TPA: hypothetical protein VMY34_08000, partial [Acidimicrobiales bacterium]|nr:hypothetical protein [Acidimicrobiales bacterium]